MKRNRLTAWTAALLMGCMALSPVLANDSGMNPEDLQEQSETLPLQETASKEAARQETPALDAEADDAAASDQKDSETNQLPVYGDSNKENHTFSNNIYYIISVPGNENLRWNMNNSGKAVNDCVHLDDKNGWNFPFRLGPEEDKHYNHIQFAGTAYYVDTEGDNNKTNKVLHNGHQDIKQANQLFRFVPVRDSSGNVKADTYYILSKKGDDSGFDLYVGLQDNKSPAKGVKIATTKAPTEWVVRAFYEPQSEPTVFMDEGQVRLYAYDDNSTAYYIAPITRDAQVRDLKLVENNGDHDISFCLARNTSNANTYTLEMTAYNQQHDTYLLEGQWMSVEDRKTNAGAKVHAWGVKQYEDMTRYWQTIQPTKYCNNVYIQNAYSKKYLAPKDGKIEYMNEMVLSDTPFMWWLESNGSNWKCGSQDGTWKQSNQGWSFEFNDGTPWKNGLIDIDGVTYLMDENGIMQTGWNKTNAGMQYFDSTGALKRGWLQVQDKWYFLLRNGTAKKGWHEEEGGNSYYLSDPDGAMVTGEWVDAEGNAWSFDASGALQKS